MGLMQEFKNVKQHKRQNDIRDTSSNPSPLLRLENKTMNDNEIGRKVSKYNKVMAKGFFCIFDKDI